MEIKVCSGAICFLALLGLLLLTAPCLAADSMVPSPPRMTASPGGGSGVPVPGGRKTPAWEGTAVTGASGVFSRTRAVRPRAASQLLRRRWTAAKQELAVVASQPL